MDLKIRAKCQPLTSATTITTSSLSCVTSRFSTEMSRLSQPVPRFSQAQKLDLLTRILQLERNERVTGCVGVRGTP